MKTRLPTLLAIACFGLTALTARAQTAPKILVVDLAKLFDNHWKTQEQRSKLQADGAKAQDQVAQLQKEGTALVDEFKALDEQSKSPAASVDAKAKAQADAQKKYEEIRKKRGELDSFVRTTQDALRQRTQTFKTLMIEEIAKIAVTIAKNKGAALLLDKSGPSMLGVSNILYFDPSLDITDDVAAEIDKDRPLASSPSAPSTTGTPPPASASGDAPTITVPGIAPGK
jgi:outer membrane protein